MMHKSGVFKGRERRVGGNRERKDSRGIDPCPLSGDAVCILNPIASVQWSVQPHTYRVVTIA